jgi:hypothetical protein
MLAALPAKEACSPGSFLIQGYHVLAGVGDLGEDRGQGR